ncbi:uncharacterized protein EAF01_001128 [Botrytis porri]|nr:uncharacterized protein EAF01_001128 [Botrytis porri]KAF7912107.1 hypothetical protein EAF01_001128 [Botrytis porri]
MSPLPNITEITGAVTDTAEIADFDVTVMEMIIYGFFAPFGIICMIFIIAGWIAILSVSIYDTIHDWRCGLLEVSESRSTSQQTNTYLISDDERARNPRLNVNNWSQYSMEEENFSSRDESSSYGTMTWMSRDEIDNFRRSIAASDEMMEVSSWDNEVYRSRP